ncbi:hypothetical protein HWV62_17561 [Athelia sp. TMB]|nr:hypothetical protein HWV62_17561 [Athelia sp. TMB]
MSLNEEDITIIGNKAVDTCPGIANPTAFASGDNPLAANFVDDPTSAARFLGGAQAQRVLNATAGVVGHDFTIASAHIDPLNEHSNKDNGFANVTRTGKADAHMDQARDMGQRAYELATAVHLAYGHAVGDEEAKQAGREALYGEAVDIF